MVHQAKKTEEKKREGELPIVGIGSSAGGLEALKSFFSTMPPAPGMAFVLISHLIPNKKSIMAEILGQYTSLPVNEITDAMQVQPNQVYVTPPNRMVSLMKGFLFINEPQTPINLLHPIDQFFRSLANDQGEKAIGVILSGSGTEGTQGVKEIKDKGGLVMVQTLSSAIHDSMPRHALSTGLADYVLPPEEMPEQLIHYWQTWKAKIMLSGPIEALVPQDLMKKIFTLIAAETGYDFSQYKRSTIVRRLQRRMSVQNIDTLPDYVKFLERNPTEVQKLYKELLITVTGFFRDPEAYEFIRKEIIPKLAEKKSRKEPFRIWIPGCATGEEAYSMAMLLKDYQHVSQRTFPVQIFATDIDKDAIEKARVGIYPASVAGDIPRKLYERYTTPLDKTVKVNTNIREMVIFSIQNVISDPPFSNIDLISCRNLLIYLEPEPQERLLQIFYYSLRPGGFLFLGTAESIGPHSDLFTMYHKKWKIFQRKNGYAVPARFVDYAQQTFIKPKKEPVQEITPLTHLENDKIDFVKFFKDSIIEEYAPTSILIDDSGEVKYSVGNVGRFLEPAAGQASLNIRDMAREGLNLLISSSIRAARKQGKQVVQQDVVIEQNGTKRKVDLTVKPFLKPHPLAGMMLVTFTEHPPVKNVKSEPKITKSTPTSPDSRLKDLEVELQETKNNLRKYIEELQSSNEELQSTNEELQSANEELQSANEELETYREEQQSINEELETVNAELQTKNQEYQRMNTDMENLLHNTKVATIFIDQDMTIKRFTPEMTKIMHLIDTDIGRPVTDITSQLFKEDITEDVKKVLETLVPDESEIQDKEGNWYLKRIIPYRTKDNTIQGVVLSLIDITKRKELEQEANKSREKYASVFTQSKAGIAIIQQHTGQIIDVNPRFEQLTGRTKETLKAMKIWDIMTPDQIKTVRAQFTTDSILGDITHRRFTFNTPQGKDIPVEFSISEIAFDNKPNYLVITHEQIKPTQSTQKS